MNAAARLVSKGTLSRSWVVSVVLARMQYATLILMAAVLMSALSIVYVTNVSRSVNASIQQLQVERNRIHIQWGQLLLEKGTWITPGRVQHIAEEQLGMALPESKSVVIVSE
jgi:cell division protein FtsL